tara:strand:- start:243 stop:1946 length:1704 start_codon:yes stop_codon:yes gene_type:complete
MAEKDIVIRIEELMDMFGGEVTTADKIQRPQSALDREMFEDANIRFNKAEGGRIKFQGGARGAYSLESGRYDTNLKKAANFGKKFFKEALKTGNFTKIKSKARGTGGVFEQFQLQNLRKAFDNPYLMKLYTKEMGITPSQFKKVLNEGAAAAREFTAASVSAARIGTPSVKLQGLIFDEILNNSNATVSSMAKKFKKTEKEITKTSSQLLKNVYTQNVAIGKGPKFDIDSRGRATLKKWLPSDFKITDKFLDNFSNIDGLKRVQTENIGILIKNAYRNDPKKYAQALKGLSEYNKFKNKLPKNLKLDLDHPLSKAFLKGSGVSPEKLLYVTPISTTYNRGFKQDLSMAYDEALLNKNKPRIKLIENFAKDLGVNIGKGSGKIKFGTTPITEKTQAGIAQETLTNLEQQNISRKKLEELKKTKEGRDKLKQIFPKGQKLTIPKVATSILKGVGKVYKPLSAVLGPAAVMSARAKADEMNIDLSLPDQAAAFALGDPQAAIDLYKMRNDPEFAAQQRAKSFSIPLDEGTFNTFAGGGIAKIAGVDSGPPPEEGPNSQGLQGLMKRGIKI